MAQVLTKKAAAAVTRLRVTIPASLTGELEDIQAQAKAHGLTLDVSSICSSALARAVKQARAELARLALQDGRTSGGQGEGQSNV